MKIAIDIHDAGELNLFENELQIGYYFVSKTGQTTEPIEFDPRIGSLVYLQVDIIDYGKNLAELPLFTEDWGECDLSIWPDDEVTK